MDNKEVIRIMEIREIYPISRAGLSDKNKIVGSNTNLIFRINIKENMRLDEDCIYVNDEYLIGEREKLLLGKAIALEGNDAGYLLKFGNYIAFACESNNKYINKMREELESEKLTYREWIVKGLLE